MQEDTLRVLKLVVPISLLLVIAVFAAMYVTAPQNPVVSFVDYRSVSGDAQDELFAEFGRSQFVVAKGVPQAQAVALVERCYDEGWSCSSTSAGNDSLRTVFGGRPGANATVNTSSAPDLFDVFSYDPQRSEYYIDGDLALRVVTAEATNDFQLELLSGYAAFLADEPIVVFLAGNSSAQDFSDWSELGVGGCSSARFFTTGLSELELVNTGQTWNQQSGYCVVRTEWNFS